MMGAGVDGFFFPDLARIPKKEETSEGARDVATGDWNDKNVVFRILQS